MKRNYILYLDDILKSIHEIKTFTVGFAFERFKADDTRVKIEGKKETYGARIS